MWKQQGQFWTVTSSHGSDPAKNRAVLSFSAIGQAKAADAEVAFPVAVRADLIAHLGGKPSVAQALMIDRICMTLLRIELMDRDALMSATPGVITERQSRDYLAWVNTAGRLLRSLGLEGVQEAGGLSEYLAARSKSEAAAA